MHKANIKIKLVCGVYMLQNTKAKCNQYEINSLCPLCQSEDENTLHFVLTCEALQTVRDPEESATARLCVSLWDTYML